VIHALVVLVLFVPGLASADAIMGPPEDCPRGSRGESSHTDTICAPSTCVVDGDCGGGTGTDALVCAANVGLCIESRTRMPGGLRPPGVEATPVTYDVASTSCSTDADCAAGTHCVVASRCAQRTATEFVRHTLGCTAQRGGTGMRVVVVAIATATVGTLWLGLRRRRSPRRARRR
jgi:hypothetical protein